MLIFKGIFSILEIRDFKPICLLLNNILISSKPSHLEIQTFSGNSKVNASRFCLGAFLGFQFFFGFPFGLPVWVSFLGSTPAFESCSLAVFAALVPSE